MSVSAKAAALHGTLTPQSRALHLGSLGWVFCLSVTSLWILLQFYGISIIFSKQSFSSVGLCTLEIVGMSIKKREWLQNCKEFISMKLQGLVAKFSRCTFEDWPSILIFILHFICPLMFCFSPQKWHINRRKKIRKCCLSFLPVSFFLKTMSAIFLPSVCTVHWAITQVIFYSQVGRKSLAEVWERGFLCILFLFIIFCR